MTTIKPHDHKHIYVHSHRDPNGISYTHVHAGRAAPLLNIPGDHGNPFADLALAVAKATVIAERVK